MTKPHITTEPPRILILQSYLCGGVRASGSLVRIHPFRTLVCFYNACRYRPNLTAAVVAHETQSNVSTSPHRVAAGPQPAGHSLSIQALCG